MAIDPGDSPTSSPRHGGDSSSWTHVPARVVRGHGVASGQRADASKYPGGSLRMQAEHFRAGGLDLSPYHFGTVNVSIAPRRYRALVPRQTFRNVRWHPTQPPEDFSFFDVGLTFAGQRFEGLIYYPHPETKPTHFQSPDVLELILPFIDGLGYDQAVELHLDRTQIEVI